jgi:hypothetical protein
MLTQYHFVYRRLRERKKSKMVLLKSEYRSDVAKMFCLQQYPAVMDLNAFLHRPTSAAFVSFLEARGSCPADILEAARSEVAALVVPLPSPPPHRPQPLTLPALGSDVTRLLPIKTEPRSESGSSTPSTSSQRQRQQQHNKRRKLHPQPSTAAKTPSPQQLKIVHQHLLMSAALQRLQTAHAAAEASSAKKARVGEWVQREPSSGPHAGGMMKNEGWVLRKVNELSREGMWSPKRLPKVCERPRPRTHHDCLLSEMQWLAVDFSQERTWKKAAARMLAHSAKVFVETWPERKEKAKVEREKKMKTIAAFQAGEVEAFWAHIADLAEAKDRMVTTAVSAMPRRLRRTSSVSAVSSPINLVNGVLDDEDNLLDDESTISEQERYEKARTSPGAADMESHIKDLVADSTRPLESILPKEYLDSSRNNAAAVLDSDDDDMDERSTSPSSLSSSSSLSSLSDQNDLSDLDVDDVEALDPSSIAQLICSVPRSISDLRPKVEKTLKVTLKPKQRKLYDDYLTTPSVRDGIERGDAREIASVLADLKKICNHPRLAGGGSSVVDTGDNLLWAPSFPRVADRSYHSLFTSALTYNPYRHVDLNSLNLVYLTHEVRLTAITSDRIRKFCAPRRLIEELPARAAARAEQKPMPAVPQGKLPEAAVLQQVAALNSVVGVRTLNRSRSMTIRQQPPPQTIPPVKEGDSKSASADSKNSSSGDNGKLAFHKESLPIIARFNERRCRGLPLYGQDLISALYVMKPSVTSPAQAKRPSTAQRLRSSRSGYLDCVNALAPSHYRAKTKTLGKLVSISAKRDERRNLKCVGESVSLVQAWNPSMETVEKRTRSDLNDLAATLRIPVVSLASADEVATSRSAPDISYESAKMEELMALLRKFRYVKFLQCAGIIHFRTKKNYNEQFIFLDRLVKRPSCSARTRTCCSFSAATSSAADFHSSTWTGTAGARRGPGRCPGLPSTMGTQSASSQACPRRRLELPASSQT